MIKIPEGHREWLHSESADEVVSVTQHPDVRFVTVFVQDDDGESASVNIQPEALDSLCEWVKTKLVR